MAEKETGKDAWPMSIGDLVLLHVYEGHAMDIRSGWSTIVNDINK